MSQYHRNGRRPHQRNRNSNYNYNSYSGPRFDKSHFKHQRDDDQIAPSSVSASTQKLQQWALATADLIQQPNKRHKSRLIEDEIRERIQQRYECPEEYRATPSENSNSPMKDRSVIDLTGDDEPFSSLKSGATNKRPRSPSPTRPTPRADLSKAGYVRSVKRARSRSPSRMTSAYSASTLHARQTEEVSMSGDEDNSDCYYQSSEWSFPSSDEEVDENR
ncbi:hypothetical protein PtrSN002B_009602 [Pyrenophora tritici-repentis]|uniref:Uncharacterized protein n=2 Tax=Pyrenophora tritici-repentis TaxID=45151 RepID=A0A2W1E4M8_9PLEO|nr:uncharacterized protein PTRG_04262 [Pyrenophora tritici-repentis Pt-1C-BFP]KAA8619645.1 hypothetical protein PtrV1_06739 [Pyrenophora tritici-repentis]EDU47100.1 predicted protein [Pyrenophora tritici-repentis Pt-1C-BFP]KAF7447785.1 hypothetical protein A1F99_071490 [Pyrenophora tritici-repentis]KAF7571487.1 hypothetical protein PtrM4_089870 [Pyrenophora tritici-repentis]KAG9385284.1 hypothetical protein A1F94_004831 [Pyrenophora tritici-repentis]